VAIRVREITGVSAPEDFLGFLYDHRAIVLQPGTNQIDFLFTPGIMGESEALVTTNAHAELGERWADDQD